MSWQQIREPNLDPYIVQPNAQGGTYTLTDWCGWCLAYVQAAFGTGWGGATAWDCWNNHTVNRHEDSNIPNGIYIPIFFSGYHGQGHAAIYKDGQVWSSPITHKPYADTWGSIAEVERTYGVTYVGWAEGIGGTPIVQHQGDMPQYTINPIEPHTFHVKANHYRWNLAQPTFDAIVANPITTSGNGLDFTAVATLTRPDLPNYTWYLDDVSTPHGWNSLDCEEPVVAPPLPAPPVPYVPPAAPVTALPAQKYRLVVNVPFYNLRPDAQFQKNQAGVLPAQEYFVFNTVDNLIQLGDDNQHPKYWVRTADNVAPVQIPVNTEQWKTTRTFFYEDRNKYDLYELQNDVLVKDLDNKATDAMVYARKDDRGAEQSDNRLLRVHGTVYKDGVKYYLLHNPEDVDWIYWYVIPAVNPDTGRAYLLKYADTYDTSPRPHDLTPAEYALAGFQKLGYRVIDGIIRFPSSIRKWLEK